MPGFDGSGNYVRVHNWTQDAANGLNINAGEMDGEDNAIAGAFNLCVTRDGQGKMAADFTPNTDGVYNLGTAVKRWLAANSVSATIGAPATGASLTVNSPASWQAATMNSTLQLTGPNKLTNANQNVNITQLMLHGQAAEMVWVNGSAGADLKVWSDFVDSAGVRHLRIENDALNATADFMTITRSGAFSGNQATVAFPIGYGSITFNPTVTNAYQCVINAGAVAGFANGLQIKAGSIAGDSPLNIQSQAGATFLNMTGQGATVLGPVSTTGLIGLAVTGIASNASPVATFGGTASNFITVTDGAGMTAIAQTATGNAVLLGATSNHALSLLTNNVAQLSISNAGAITFANVAVTSTSPVAGGAGALPATPAGYFALTIGATARRVPFYT